MADNAPYGRVVDGLPGEVTAPFESFLVRRLDTVELSRALGIVANGLLNEIGSADEELTKQLQATLVALTENTF